jgi:hypothetical protein
LAQSRLAGFRRLLTALFDDDATPNRAAQIFNAALAVFIVCNVGLVIVESVSWMRDRYDPFFEYF